MTKRQLTDEECLPPWKPRHGRHRDGTIRTIVRGHDVAQRVVGYRAETDEDGFVVDQKEVSLPNQPYEKWLSPAGDAVALVVGTNRGGLCDDQRRYRDQKRRTFVEAGGLPYSLELATQFGLCPPKTNEDKWHAHIQKQAATLKEKNRSKQQAQFENVDDRTLSKLAKAIVSAQAENRKQLLGNDE